MTDTVKTAMTDTVNNERLPMKRIAITGGIGSGKSYVCRMLGERGIRVYDCDAAAKRLMRTSVRLQESLRRLVGNGVYSDDGNLCKRVLAEFILKGEANKTAVNEVVHPAVADDFLQSGMSWLESAILFESGFDRRVDFASIVCVTASREVRIKRIMQRDNLDQTRAEAWIDAQMPQEDIAHRSDFRISNDGDDRHLCEQIDDMLRSLGWRPDADGNQWTETTVAAE